MQRRESESRLVNLTRGEVRHLLSQIDVEQYQEVDEELLQEPIPVRIPKRFRAVLEFEDGMYKAEEGSLQPAHRTADALHSVGSVQILPHDAPHDDVEAGQQRRIEIDLHHPQRQSNANLGWKHTLRSKVATFSLKAAFFGLVMWVVNRFVFFQWIRKYSWRDNLRGDFMAGLTVAAMLVPQGLAYASIAGLPPVIGLYSSVVPQLLYALTGSSRHLAFGPVAIMSLLQANALKNIPSKLPDGSANPDYLKAAFTTAFFVGVIQVTMCIFRLGFLVNFLSHPVVAGFTSASAIIIGFSQMNAVFGFDFDKPDSTFVTIVNFFKGLRKTHPATVAMGLVSIAFLLGIRRVPRLRRLPAALIVVIVCTLVTWLARLDQKGIKITGKVPAGPPAASSPEFSEGVSELFVAAVVMSMLGYMESSAVAKIYASKGKYAIDSNQELFALGIANLIGCFFSSYPCTGGFSRTAVNAVAGARTLLSAVIAALCVLLVLVLITPWFFYLPKPVLGAIVVAAVVGLFDTEEPKFLWRVSKLDFIVFCASFLLVMQLGVEIGLGAAVGVSMFLQVIRAATPTFAVLARVAGTFTFRNIEHLAPGQIVPGVLVLRFDRNLHFANVERFADILRSTVDREDMTVRVAVLDFSAVSYIDSTAIHSLGEVFEELHHRNKTILISNKKGPLQDTLVRSGLLSIIGATSVFATLEDAVEAADVLIQTQHPQQDQEITNAEVAEVREMQEHDGVFGSARMDSTGTLAATVETLQHIVAQQPTFEGNPPT